MRRQFWGLIQAGWEDGLAGRGTLGAGRPGGWAGVLRRPSPGPEPLQPSCFLAPGQAPAPLWPPQAHDTHSPASSDTVLTLLILGPAVQARCPGCLQPEGQDQWAPQSPATRASPLHAKGIDPLPLLPCCWSPLRTSLFKAHIWIPEVTKEKRRAGQMRRDSEQLVCSFLWPRGGGRGPLPPEGAVEGQQGAEAWGR